MLTLQDRLLWFGCGSFLVHEVFWIFLNLPYVLVERNPAAWIAYKIQPTKKNSYEEQWSMFATVLREHVCFMLPLCLLMAACPGVEQLFILKFGLTDLPNIWWALLQIIIARTLQEIMFYLLHRLCHTNEYLFNNIHRVHHENNATFALAAEHAHFIESVVVFSGTFVMGIVLVSYLIAPMHVYTLYAALLYTLICSVESHCGYQMPWHFSPLGWNGGALHHDRHHLLYSCNFGERWLDTLFGTEYAQVKEVKKKRKA